MRLDVDDQRTSRNAGWLPAETDWPELAELRERHLGAVEAWDAALAARREITGRHEAEDAERAHRLQVAMKAGKRPKVRQPDPVARDAELTAAQEQVDAAGAVLNEVFVEILGSLRALEPTAIARLQAAQDAAEEERRRAREAVIAAECEVYEVQRLATWFDRTVNRGSVWRIAYDSLPPAEPTPEPDWASILGGSSVTEISHA